MACFTNGVKGQNILIFSFGNLTVKCIKMTRNARFVFVNTLFAVRAAVLNLLHDSASYDAQSMKMY